MSSLHDSDYDAAEQGEIASQTNSTHSQPRPQSAYSVHGAAIPEGRDDAKSAGDTTPDSPNTNQQPLPGVTGIPASDSKPRKSRKRFFGQGKGLRDQPGTIHFILSSRLITPAAN